nr:BTAD domain-containing putative transcriptional regulator [Micromonospora sp. DSM 115978]
METRPRTVGGLLRSYRVRSGSTQRDLASRAGISVRALRDLECDRTRHPRTRAIAALAEALALGPGEHEDLRSTLTTRDATRAGTATRIDVLRIDVLGPLSVRHGLHQIDIAPAKQRLLLGLLAIQPGRPVSIDEIVEQLWPDQPPRTHLGLVHSYVARLRRGLAARKRGGGERLIVSVRGGYRLDPAHADLDVVRFETLLATARLASTAGDDVEALSAYGGALRLWRGPALVDLGAGLHHHPAAAALSRRRLSAALAYSDLAIARGDHEPAAAVLHELAATETLHEGLYAQLMLALAGSGQQAAALRLFDGIRARLTVELGVAPGAEISAAHLRVLRQDLPPRRTLTMREPAGDGRVSYGRGRGRCR